jgi:hypothetical protein
MHAWQHGQLQQPQGLTNSSRDAGRPALLKGKHVIVTCEVRVCASGCKRIAAHIIQRMVQASWDVRANA